METTKYVMFTLCLAFAFAVATGAGLPSALGISGTAASAGTIDDALYSKANDSVASGSDLEGQVDGTDDNSLISMAINSGQAIAGIVSMLALLPLKLRELGLPAYAAYPAGAFMQVITGVGVMQFITQREWF